MLLFHQTDRGENQQVVKVEDCKMIKIFSSMSKNTEPEKNEPTTWTLKYAIPYDVIKKYMPVDIPSSGVKWRGNFYKCADLTSHPHWLTWSKVDKANPDFHVPQSFGTLVFE